MICTHDPWLHVGVDGALKQQHPTRSKLSHTGEVTPQKGRHTQEQSQMDASLSTAIPTATQNDTLASQPTKYKSQNWEFLVAVLVTAISASILIALLARCQVVRRYLASYRHTRLRETDTISHCDPTGLDVEFAMHGARGMDPHCIPAVSEEDDDGFIEDNYIPASERARAERAAENMEDTEDTEEELDEIEFTIA